MQIRGLRHLLVGVALCVGVVGCSHNAKNGVNGKDSGYGASTQGAGDGSEFSGVEDRDLLAKRKFYFAYDRSDMSEGDYEAIYAHAEFLKTNPNHHVRVEGHADEHGSREYNIALGERRARTVSNALISQGVAPHQVATVSYGKEKPEAMGHDEEAFRLNRRAVIVYEN
ncbi:MAG: peptidoglycan-associated lipoprotein Pal [Candidatus Berkiella sp.]